MMDFFVSMTLMAVTFIPSLYAIAWMMRGVRQKWYAVIILIGLVFLITFPVFLSITYLVTHFAFLDKNIVMDLYRGFSFGCFMGGAQEIKRGIDEQEKS